MKVVELKKFDIEIDVAPDKSVETEFSYAMYMLSALNNIPQGGLLPTEMHDRLKVIKKIKEAKKKLELEDSEFKLLYDLIRVQKFTLIHQAFVDYREYFDELNKEPKEKK